MVANDKVYTSKNSLKMTNKDTYNLSKAFDQVSQKDKNYELLNVEEKELIFRCISRYVDSDEFDELICQEEQLSLLILIAAKIGLGIDFIDELKLKLF